MSRRRRPEPILGRAPTVGYGWICPATDHTHEATREEAPTPPAGGWGVGWARTKHEALAAYAAHYKAAHPPEPKRRPGVWPQMQPWPGVTLMEARDWLREHEDEGTHCPACNQLVKVYWRRLNSGMAYSLIRLAAAVQGQADTWVHKPTVLRGVGSAARDESLLRFWGLLEEAGEDRVDGGRSGWWRVTERGALFVHGHILVPEYAVIYDNRLLRTEGPHIGIETALGKRFSYNELMGWAL